MLFASVDYNSQAYANGVLIGSLLAGLVCGLWPLLAGASKGQPILGALGLFVCIISGYVLGLLLALPVAFVFAKLIGAMHRPKPPVDDASPAVPFNPYANGKRSAFD
jgi:hypothetical protein